MLTAESPTAHKKNAVSFYPNCFAFVRNTGVCYSKNVILPRKGLNPIIDHNRIWYLFCIQFSIRMSVSICVLFCSFGFFCCARALSDPHHARGGGGGGG